MIDLAALERHRNANKRLVGLVTGQLRQFFGKLDLKRPETARDNLLTYVPAMVEQYAPISEQLGLEYYQSMMLVGGAAAVADFEVQTPPLLDLTEAVTANVRYAAGHLFSDKPKQALKPLELAVNKHVRTPGREAIIWNAVAEGARWARVPQGAQTCSFCLILASRGADYISERSAGSERYGEENKFHGECDCEVVRFGIGDEYPENYLPDEMYDFYKESAKYAGTNDLNALLYDFRRRFPEMVTDAVYDDEYLSKMG